MINDTLKADNIILFQMDSNISQVRDSLDGQNIFSCGLFRRTQKNNTLDKNNISLPVRTVVPAYVSEPVSALPVLPSHSIAASSGAPSSVSLAHSEASIDSILSYYGDGGNGFTIQNSSSSSFPSSYSSGEASRSSEEGGQFSSPETEDNFSDLLTPLMDSPQDNAPAVSRSAFLSVPDDFSSLHSRVSKTFSDVTEMTDLTKPSDDPLTVDYTSVPLRNSEPDQSDDEYATQLNIEGNDVRHLFYQGNRARIMRRIAGNIRLGQNNG